MTALTLNELADFKTVQTGHMMDECVYVRRTTTTNAYGGSTETWVDGDTLACGFSFSPRELRLPHGTAVNECDRIRITKRFGVAESTPITYEIIWPAHSGPSGVVVNLERLTE